MLIAAGLSIYKPRGRTPYGMRFAASAEEAERAPGWMTAFKIAVGLLLAFVIVKHLAGGGMGNHGP